MASVSIIILNWNGKHLLNDCIQSVLQQKFPDFEVLVVDNGSTDGSVEYVKSTFPGVRVVPLTRNMGFCGGNNFGVSCSKGDYIVLLNNDTQVETDWLVNLYTVMEEHSTAVVADSAIYYFDDRNTLWASGADYSIAGSVNSRVSGGAGTTPEKVFAAVGCSAMYRRSVWNEIGGLDDDFFAGYEDIDWSFRARLMGYEVINVPTSKVYHKVSATHKYNSPAFVYHGQRNVSWVYFKNMPPPLLERYFPLHLFYCFGSFLYFSSMGHSKSFLKAKRDAFAAWQAIIGKRKKIQAMRRSDVAELDKLLNHQWLQRKIIKFRSF